MQKEKAEEKKTTINETLNEILLQIFTGIDYATKIALKTNKSIPVVYRQLDSLVDFGILTKQRAGKKVTYAVNWINLSDIMTSALYLDIEKIRKITKAEEKETRVLSELRSLIEDVPKELFTSEKALAKVVKNFFSYKEVIVLIENFFREVENAGKEHIDFKKLSFEETINLLIDIFGMLDKQQQAKMTRKLNIKESSIKNFMKYCRIKYLQKQVYDPRNRFINAMEAN